MKIAVLGWGSLIWDKRDLLIIGDWQKGGPVLPIEFSRVSRDGRLTLVIDPINGGPVTTRYAVSECDSLDQAIANLRQREENPPAERIGFVNLVSNAERDWSRQHHPSACDGIKAWAQANDFEAVIWTALISNFTEKRNKPFSAAAAVDHVAGLSAEQQAKALEYIQKAPVEVDTAVRRLVFAQNPGVGP